MAGRNGFKVWDAIDMTASDEWIHRTSTNYGFYIQASWAGLIGSGTWKVEGSNDGQNWETFPQFLPIAQQVVLERNISGTTGVSSFEKSEWFPDWMRIVYDAGTTTAGNLTLTITLINKQNKH